MQPFNPDDWKDVLVLLFLGVCGVITAGLPLWLKVRSIEDRSCEIKEQVSNAHDENLRDEITRGFKELQAALADHRSETALNFMGIREEMRTERLERIAGDKLRVVVKEE